MSSYLEQGYKHHADAQAAFKRKDYHSATSLFKKATESYKAHQAEQEAKAKKPLKEEQLDETSKSDVAMGHQWQAQEHKKAAAKHPVGSSKHHFAMAAYHESMAEHHHLNGNHHLSDRHSDHAEEHIEKAHGLHENWRHEHPDSVRSQASAALRRNAAHAARPRSNSIVHKSPEHHKAIVDHLTKHGAHGLMATEGGHYHFGGSISKTHRENLHHHLKDNGWKHTPPHSHNLGHTYTKDKHEIHIGDKGSFSHSHHISVKTLKEEVETLEEATMKAGTNKPHGFQIHAGTVKYERSDGNLVESFARPGKLKLEPRRTWTGGVVKPRKPRKSEFASVKAPAASLYDLSHVSRIVSTEVADHFPDSDGWDSAASKVIKKYPHLTLDTVGAVMDKATKHHLGASSFSDYVEDMHASYKS